MPCSDQMIESKRKRKAGALASEKVCGVESFFKRVKAVKGEAAEKKQRPHGTKVTAISFAPKLTSVFLTYSPLEYNRTPPELDIFSCDSCSCTILGERHHCGVCDYDLCVCSIILPFQARSIFARAHQAPSSKTTSPYQGRCGLSLGATHQHSLVLISADEES